MQEWSIYPSGITSDNASNVTKAVKLLQNSDDELLLAYDTKGGPSPFYDDASDYDDNSEQLLQLSGMKIAHIKCFAHTLNIAAQKALSVSSESLANVRKVVKHFQKSARLACSRSLTQARPNNISC